MVPSLNQFSPESVRAILTPTHSADTELKLRYMSVPTRFRGYALQCGCYHWQLHPDDDSKKTPPPVMFARCNYHQMFYLHQRIHELYTDIAVLSCAPVTERCRPCCGTASVCLYPGPWYCASQFFPPRYFCSPECRSIASSNMCNQNYKQ